MIKRALTKLIPVAAVAAFALQYAPDGTFGHWLGGFGNAIAGERTCTGQVLHVIDGDTLWMRCNGQKTKVRFDYIDAPEVAHPYWDQPGQPGGERARSVLINLIDGRPVTLSSTGQDDYGRTLGQLSVSGKNLNLALVRKGWAWAYPGYTTKRYKRAEQKARNAKRGLWALPASQREAPWKFRHRH